MTGRPDPQRSQIIRQQCGRVLSGKRIPDIVGALEMLVADTILGLPGQDETTAQAGADAIAADIRNIIRERFAAKQGGH